MLPNNPLVRQLKPVQVEWINWNLRQEAEKINGGRNGDGFRLESALDIPGQLFNNSGRPEGAPAGDFLGKQG